MYFKFLWIFWFNMQLSWESQKVSVLASKFMILYNHSVRNFIHSIKINLSPTRQTSRLLIDNKVISFFFIACQKFSSFLHGIFLFLLSLLKLLLNSLNFCRAQHYFRFQCVWRNEHIIIQTKWLHFHSWIFTQALLVTWTSNRWTPAKPNVVELINLEIENHSCNSNLIIAHIRNMLSNWTCNLNKSITKSSTSNWYLLA